MTNEAILTEPRRLVAAHISELDTASDLDPLGLVPTVFLPKFFGLTSIVLSAKLLDECWRPLSLDD